MKKCYLLSLILVLLFSILYGCTSLPTSINEVGDVSESGLPDSISLDIDKLASEDISGASAGDINVKLTDKVIKSNWVYSGIYMNIPNLKENTNYNFNYQTVKNGPIYAYMYKYNKTKRTWEVTGWQYDSKNLKTYNKNYTFSSNYSSIFIAFYSEMGGNVSAEFKQVQSPSIKTYKIGVVYFFRTSEAKNMSNDLVKMSDDLVKIKKDLTDDFPFRVSGDKAVQLVVQTEVSWFETYPTNFSKYKTFASKISELGLKWTPLLSYHYVPSEIYENRKSDLLRDSKGNIFHSYNSSKDGLNRYGSDILLYLPFSPSSSIWGNEASNWTKAFITAMKPYLGSAIDEIFLGNEILYPKGGKFANCSNNILASRDQASITKWKSKYSGDLPSSFTETYKNFRADELSYTINSLVQTAKKELPGNIKVSTKFVPYAFNADTNDGACEQYCGYTNNSLSFLGSQLDFIGIDSYPTLNNYPPYPIENDYKKTKDIFKNKEIYLAEFNRNGGGITSSEVKAWLKQGMDNYNVKYATIFAWNSDDVHEIEDNQEIKNSLKEVINGIASYSK